MEIHLEDRLAAAAQILHRLAEQNMMLSSRIIALENVLSHAIARQFPDGQTGAEALAQFSAQVRREAVHLATLIRSWDETDLPSPVEVPRSMERLLSRADTLRHQRGTKLAVARTARPAANDG